MAFNFSSVLPQRTFVTRTETDTVHAMPRKVAPGRPGSIVYFPVQQSALAS